MGVSGNDDVETPPKKPCHKSQVFLYSLWRRGCFGGTWGVPGRSEPLRECDENRSNACIGDDRAECGASWNGQNDAGMRGILERSERCRMWGILVRPEWRRTQMARRFHGGDGRRKGCFPTRRGHGRCGACWPTRASARCWRRRGLRDRLGCGRPSRRICGAFAAWRCIPTRS